MLQLNLRAREGWKCRVKAIKEGHKERGSTGRMTGQKHEQDSRSWQCAGRQDCRCQGVRSRGLAVALHRAWGTDNNQTMDQVTDRPWALKDSSPGEENESLLSA